MIFPNLVLSYGQIAIWIWQSMLKILRGSALLIGVATLLGGCASAPRTTEADIPLVHASLAYSLSAEQDVAINIPKLNTAFHTNSPISITYQGQSYKTSKYYVSASGNQCMRLDPLQTSTVSSQREQRLTACNRNGQWSVIAPLVVSTDE